MKILFVCTGNTCRSPMAEVIAKKIFLENNIKHEVYSAGLHAFEGMPTSLNAINAVKDYDIDLTNHSSKQVNKEMLDSVDLILTMTNYQKEIILELNDLYKRKVFTLHEFCGKMNDDIVDPFGTDLSSYKECAKQIYNLISRSLYNFRDKGEF